MRPPARLILGIGALIACGVAPPRTRAQGYVPPARRAGAPGTYDYVPQSAATHAAPTIAYSVPPRTYYARPPAARVTPLRPRGLLRVRKYRDSIAYPYVLVDPNNPHWTFDYNQWMAHNF